MSALDLIEMARQEAASTDPISFEDVMTAIRVAVAAGELEFAGRMLAAIEEQEANIHAYRLQQAMANPGVHNSH